MSSSTLWPTVEVRWFLAEACVPQAAADWLLAGRASQLPVAWEPPRSDQYLLLPGVDGVGVKLREGRLEIKARRGVPQSVAFPHGVAGEMDSWLKWSLDDAAVQSLLAAHTREPGWITVEKRRLVRRFSLAQAVPEDIDGASLPASGCSVEVTCLKVPDAALSAWTTVGLEAFGPAPTLAMDLQRVAVLIFGRGAAPWRLAPENSAAYPSWLGGLRGSS